MTQIAGWTELDDRAVAYARALAMDAVQKVGNGHPGTAMSLAPVAYNLFQRHLVHDPANPDWLGRDRFILSCGHSSLTLYTQLFFSGLRVDVSFSITRFCVSSLPVFSLTTGHSRTIFSLASSSALSTIDTFSSVSLSWPPS